MPRYWERDSNDCGSGERGRGVGQQRLGEGDNKDWERDRQQGLEEKGRNDRLSPTGTFLSPSIKAGTKQRSSSCMHGPLKIKR